MRPLVADSGATNDSVIARLDRAMTSRGGPVGSGAAVKLDSTSIDQLDLRQGTSIDTRSR